MLLATVLAFHPSNLSLFFALNNLCFQDTHQDYYYDVQMH